MKKYLIVVLVSMMVMSLIGTVGFAQDEFPAAPAIAAEFLRDAGVEQLGPYVSAVARETRGREATFQGLKKSDPGYREAVRDFLVKMNGVPFSPSYVHDMVLWLDASAITVDDLDESGNVVQWRDESGRGNDAEQTLENMRPAYLENAVGGLPAVFFDGSNKRLDVADDETLDGMEGFHIYAVIIPNLLGNNYQRIVDKVWNGSYAFYINNDGNLAAAIRTAGDGTGGSDWWQGQFGHRVTANNAYLTMLCWDAEIDKANIYLDGVAGAAQGRTGDTIGTTSAPLYIGDRAGSDRSLNGYIAEIIIYNRALKDAERVNIETYLMDKYGLQNN